MYTYKKVSDKNQTLIFEVTLEKDAISKEYGIKLKELSKKVKVEGFREGKAPFELAKKQVKQEKVYDSVLQSLLGKAYDEIIKKDDIKPVMQPHLKLKSAKPDSDWTIELSIALEPKIELPDYKKMASEVKASMKKEDIWVPGKSAEAPDEKEQDRRKHKMLDEILAKIMDGTKLTLSDLVIDHEMNSRLARLVDDAQKVGLSMESYLNSKGLTEAQLKDSIKKEIADTYKIEYALSKIGDEEKITVDEADLNSIIESAKDAESKERVKKNLYFYSTVIRKQKILDYLLSL